MGRRAPLPKTARRRGRPAAAALALAALLGLAAPGAAQKGLGVELPRVGHVRLDGLHVLDAGDLKKLLKTQGRPGIAFWAKGAYYRADFVQADLGTIREFAAQHGLLDAQATARALPDSAHHRVDVLFTVAEGPRSFVRSLEIVGEHALRPAEVRAKIATRAGDPFNPQRLALDRQAVSEAYADKGYFPAIAADWTRTDSVAVAVRIAIEEGPPYRTGSIAIEGVTAVDTSAVRRELVLRPGHRFERKGLISSSERLYETSLFQVVDFEPARVDTDSAVVDLRLRLRERRHRWIEGGAGYGSGDGLRLLGGWGNGNLFHRGRQVEISSRYAFGSGKGQRRFANRLRYTEPWIFGIRMRAEFGGYFEQRDELFRDATFSQRIWGAYWTVKRRLSPFTQATLGLDNQWSIPRSTVPDSLLAGFPQNQLFVQRLSLLLQYDRRDDVFDPHRGEYYEMTGELAGRLLGRARQFNKGTVTGDWYLPLRGRSTLALRLQVGTIVARAPNGEAPLEGVPLQDLFRTGGAYTVRGYPEESIVGADGTGGLLLLISNAEYRFPVAGPVFAALFVDGGNVWSRRRDFKLRQLGLGPGPAGGNDYRWSSGLSGRLQTPLGPFRVDVAYRLRGQERDPKRAGLGFHLSIGQPF